MNILCLRSWSQRRRTDRLRYQWMRNLWMFKSIRIKIKYQTCWGCSIQLPRWSRRIKMVMLGSRRWIWNTRLVNFHWVMPLADNVISTFFVGNRRALIVSRLVFMDLRTCPKNSKKLWIILFRGCRELIFIFWTIFFFFERLSGWS